MSITYSDYPSWYGFPIMMQAGAIAAVVVEYSLAFGLFYRATRAPLMILGTLLHATFYLLLPVSTFSATMVCLYLAYCDPDFVHQTIDSLLGQEPSRTRQVSPS